MEKKPSSGSLHHDMKTDFQAVMCTGSADHFGVQANAVKVGGNSVKAIDDGSCAHTKEQILPGAGPGATEMFPACISFPLLWTNLFFPFCSYKPQLAYPKTCHPL